jgi:hypothetical protein
MNTLLAAGLLITLGAGTCALPDERAGTALDYSTVEGYTLTTGDTLLARYAPVFMVEGYAASLNRIGAPSARYDKKGEEEIYVDPEHPVYYTQVREFETEHGKFTNLIYRVHFEMSTSNGYSTNGGKGYNVGLMAIITLDAEQRPVLLNIVHTCGCFHALLPTTYTPDSALPEGWDKEKYRVYGETLPGVVRYPEPFVEEARPVIYLREGSHRAVEVQVGSLDSIRERYTLHESEMAPMDALEHLKLGDGETSFYYTEGKNKGLVKGAIKKRESLLLGAVVGDSRAGQDRIYGSPEELTRGFYTTIKPGAQEESDMWDYAAFLDYNGWKL